MNYNLPDSNFKNVPLSTNNKFSVYSLNDQGLEHYLGSDSYTHHYLNKIDPKILKEFMEEEEELKKKKAQLNQHQKEVSHMPQQNEETIKESKASLEQSQDAIKKPILSTKLQPQSQPQQIKPKQTTNKQPQAKKQDTKKIAQPTQKIAPVIAYINQSNRLKK